MTQLQHYIVSYFDALPSQQLDQISSEFEMQVLKKGEFLCQAGDRCKKMAFVQSGLMRMYLLVDGKEVTQWISTPGYFAVDIASFIFGVPAKLNIQALVDTEVHTITANRYQSLHLKIPKWQEIEKTFLIKCFSLMEDRIIRLLSLSAEDRYNQLFEQNSELFNQVPLQYIASMLGMTPETFSRIRKKQLG